MAINRITIYSLVVWVHILHHQHTQANPPIIHYSHNMRILKIPYSTEKGSIVYRIKATDADNDNILFDILEDYGKMLLRFEKINHNEANVILTSTLQQNEEYNLTIYATDNNESTYIESRLIATTTENYKPEDINPIILEQNPIYIDENENLNKSLTIVKAYDREDSKLPVTFELMENADIFDFRYIFGPRGMSTAEIVLINYLNYEQQNLYILTLITINAKTNKEIDTRNVHSVKLTIVVKDVQDTPPVFHNLPNIITVDSLYKTRSIIYNISAEDGDATNKRNVTFSVEKPNDQYFQVHPNGSIWPTVSYETIKEMYDISMPVTVSIQAYEIYTKEILYNKSIVSTTSQLIVVFTEHNTQPYFVLSTLVGSINEHSAPMTVVKWDTPDAQVFDANFGFNGTIELDVIDSTHTFLIEPKIAYRNASFNLLVNNSQSLDFESRTNLTVIITAKDSSKEVQLTANISCIIQINDINDNIPQFTQDTFRASIYEDAKEGTEIARISAVDKDSGNFGQVRYTAIKGSFAVNLHLDFKEGTVTLIDNQNIDRESIEEYWVLVEARDNLGQGNVNTTQLYIQILDINDNPPVFLQTNYLTVVESDLSGFVQPLQLTAIDIDEFNTSNSVVNYEILHGNYENIFHLDGNTGDITMSPAKRKQLKSNPVTLTVRAYDLGIPQMSSAINISIYIISPPNSFKTLFVTDRKLNLQQGNNSIEKNLSDLSGGNVTIQEFIPFEHPRQIAIVTTVRYANETKIDLDKLPLVYNNLIDQMPIEYRPNISKVYRPIEYIKVNMTESASTQTPTGRSIQTAGSNKINILIWIILFLLLLLFLFFLYLIYLLFQNRKKSNVLIKQTDISQMEKSDVREKPKQPKSRKIRLNKRNKINKVVSLQTNKTNPKFEKSEIVPKTEVNVGPNNQMASGGDEKSPQEGIVYEVEKEKKYSTTPNEVTYYEFKRLRCPRQSDTFGERLMGETSQSNGSIFGLIKEKFDKTKQTMTNNLEQNSKTLVAVDDDAPQSSLTHVTNRYINNVLNDSTDPVVLPKSHDKVFDSMYHEDTINNKNMQKKSIFSITYDKINKRHTLSSGSEKNL